MLHFHRVTVFGVLLTLFNSNHHSWLEVKAMETDTNWDDTAKRFLPEGFEILLPEMEI
jgi:hypothetical protein